MEIRRNGSWAEIASLDLGGEDLLSARNHEEP